MVTFFGAPTIMIAKIWELIVANNIGTGSEKKISNKEHPLWALHHMKQAPDFTVLCKTMMANANKCLTKKTVLKWVWFCARETQALEDTVIVWDHRKTDDCGDDCLVLVDCIDCQFQQILVDHPEAVGKKIVNKALHSHRFHGPALLPWRLE